MKEETIVYSLFSFFYSAVAEITDADADSAVEMTAVALSGLFYFLAAVVETVMVSLAVETAAVVAASK